MAPLARHGFASDSSDMGVLAHSSVEGFFHDVLSDAIEEQGLTASVATEGYLVNLLSEFAHNQVPDDPLTVKYAMAGEGEASRAVVLKEVGDTSLYVSGFFKESLKRRAVASEHYVDLGGAAYAQLADLFGSRSILGEVYDELAAGFARFVSVLGLVRSQLHIEDNLEEVYKRWAVSPTPALEQQLRKFGVIVNDNNDNKA